MVTIIRTHRPIEIPKPYLMPTRFIGAKLGRNVLRVLAAEPAQALAIKLTLLETWVGAVDRT
jgi:hypothetical protein